MRGVRGWEGEGAEKRSGRKTGEEMEARAEGWRGRGAEVGEVSEDGAATMVRDEWIKVSAVRRPSTLLGSRHREEEDAREGESAWLPLLFWSGLVGLGAGSGSMCLFS